MDMISPSRADNFGLGCRLASELILSSRVSTSRRASAFKSDCHFRARCVEILNVIEAGSRSLHPGS